MANRENRNRDRNRNRVLKESEHPYFTGYAAGATGSPFVQTLEAWRFRVGKRLAAQGAGELTTGYAEGRSVAMRLETER